MSNLKLKKEGVLLSKTANEFENEGVCNPAVFQDGENLHIFYRAVRKGNYSTIGYCRLKGPLDVVERHIAPLLSPKFDYESHGIEDPRIVKIDDTFFLSFTSYDGINALGALATSKDMISFDRQGIITAQITYEHFKSIAENDAQLNEKYKRFHLFNNKKSDSTKTLLLWDKNLIFFPRRINGKLCFLHRIKPDIQVAFVNEISELNASYWDHYFMHLHEHIVLSPKYEHEISYIGGGCPPIETEAGWFIIYHGVHDTAEGYVYSACAALLAIDDPKKEIARLPYPLFTPELPWELRGEVNNVVFPTGAAIFEELLYIYYGAADKRIAVASINLLALTTELIANKIR